MKKKIDKYLSIYRGVKIPWIMLIIWTVVSMMQMQAEVKSVSISANIIDASQNAIKSNDLVRYVVSLTVMGILTIANIWLGAKVQETIDLRVRVKLWNKIMRLPTKYYDVDNGDELVTRVTSDASAAHEYFTLAVSSVMSVYGFIVVYQQLFKYHKTLAAWSLLVIPFTLLIGAFYCVLSYRTGFRVNRSLAASIGYLADRVRNLKLIKSFGMEEKESEMGNELYKKQFVADNFNALCISLIQVAMQAIGCAFLIISFVAGGQLVAAGELTVGKLVGFYSMSGVMGIRMSQLFMNMGSAASTTGCLRKIAEIFEAEEEPQDGAKVEEGQQDLRFAEVAFAYNEEVPVLQGVNCIIPAGKVTALLGTNGAGKSTLTKMLTRMYEPDKGSIYFGEKNISEYNLHDWRNKFAVVAQDNPLMSGTVRENILYGVEREVSEEELIKVAKMANIYDFVMEKQGGFDAEVGIGGGNFSGGQRQCIAIARAMLRGSDYLLLDEVTSNLDVKSAQLVQSALNRLMEGRTVIMIAHTCAATTCAENIVVMSDGRVEDAGSPEELLGRNAYYRAFVKSDARIEKRCICE